MRYLSFGSHYRSRFFLCIAIIFSLAVLLVNAGVTFASVKSQISAGWFHSFALNPNGKISGWGYNESGQLGDGTNISKNIPVELKGIKDVKAVSGGWLHTIAAKSDGTVWAWGDNKFGQLGDKTNTGKKNPVQVTGLSDVVAIACGGFYTTALKSDGTVWAWGDNVNGQLGNGTNTKSNIPVQVSGLSDVIAIACGHSHTVILKSDGTVWTWGLNSYGQLGDGTTVSKNTPVEINDLSGIIAIASGALHTVALKSDGTVWTWGINFDGELGDGTTTNRKSPVQVSGLTDVFSIASGKYHSFAQKSDGTLWAWGLNNYGQLGDGTDEEYRDIPVEVSQVEGLGDIVSIVGGLYHTHPQKPDGKILARGQNIYGQLGDGTNDNKDIYVEVKNLNVSNSVTVVKTTTPHTVDGNLDESDWDIITDVSNVVAGTADNTVKFGVLWDDSYLYVGVMVLDSNLSHDSQKEADDDGVEVYIDGNNEHNANYDSNDRQFIQRWNDATLFEKDGNTTDVFHGWTAIPGGYSVELAIPWTNIGILPVIGMRMGFDVGNNDDDDGEEREGQAMWTGTANNDKNTVSFGDIILAEVLPPVATPTPTPSTSPTPVFTPQVTPIPSPVFNSLAASYAFEEGKGTIVADASNNGNYGTIDGATWATGKNSSLLNYDGIDDCVEIPGLLGQPSNITLSAWAKLDAIDIGGAEILSLGDYVALRIDATSGTSGTRGFYYDGTSWRYTGTEKFYAGTGWHHFVYVVDDTNNIQKIYIDGVVMGSTAHVPSISYAGLGSNTFIGRHGNGIDNYDFRGLIDDVQIYNQALNDREVLDLYKSACLISCWKFDEGSGTIAKDSAGNNDGAVNGATWAIGKCDGSLGFDGVDDYVEIPGLLGQSAKPTNITISAWALLSAKDTSGAELISLGDYVAIRLDSDGNGGKGTTGFYYDGNTWRGTFTGVMYAGTGWHHFVYVIDDFNNIQKMYVDGILLALTAYTPSVSYAGLGSHTFVGRHGNGFGNYNFHGLIDDVQVYNQALSDQAVQDLYDNACNVKYSNVSQGNGTDVNTSTHETVYSGVPRAGDHEGKIGTYGSIDDVFVLYPYINNDEFSFSARFYKAANDTAGGNVIFEGCRQNSTRLLSEGFDVRFSQNSPDRVIFKVVTQKINGSKTRRTATYRMSNSSGKWHSVAGTYKKNTGEQKLYIDGRLVDTKKHPRGNTLVPFIYYSDMRTGRSKINKRYSHIILDDSRMYNRALSNQEIHDLYKSN